MKKSQHIIIGFVVVSLLILSSCSNTASPKGEGELFSGTSVNPDKTNPVGSFTLSPGLDSRDSITGVGIVTGGKYVEAKEYVYEGYFCTPGANGEINKSTIEGNPDIPHPTSPAEQLGKLPVFELSSDFDVIVNKEHTDYTLEFGKIGESGKTETAPSDLKKGEYLLTVTVYTGNYELYFNGMIPPIDKETQFVCSYRFLAICVVK